MANGKPHYDHSPYPAVVDQVDGALTQDQRQALDTLYGEVCNTWRALMDVRFKLLGLVPFVTVGVLVVILRGTGPSEVPRGSATALVCGIGFFVTLGLLTYEVRNSELYNDLVSRGRRIEAELGIKRGVFRGRPDARRRFVNHGTAIAIGYVAALSGWAIAFIFAVVA